MDRLKGKVAIVAGSASGIGACTAKMMAGEGASVVLADLNLKGAEQNAAEIRSNGGEAAACAMDISKEQDVKAMVDFAAGKYGGIDILCNCAADFSAEVIGPDSAADILNVDISLLDRVLKVNLKGYVLTCKYIVPEMIKRGSGSIINISSGVSLMPEATRHCYSISKAGVNMLTKCVATSYGKKGIRCNAVLPGLIGNQEFPQEYVNSYLKASLLTRIGIPEDVGNYVIFLASDESSFITGQIILIDGGLKTTGRVQR